MHMEGREGSRVILGCEGSVGGGNGTVEMKDSPSSTPSPSPPPPPLGERVVADMGGVGPPPPPPPPPVATGMMMGFGMGTTGSGGGGGGGEDLARKKRGRPRKYGPDGGNMEERGGGMALALIPTSPFSPNSSAAGAKRGRGRPPGSGRRQLLAALGEWFAYSAGGNFTPHVVTIAAGEDVAAKILSFSQKGPRAVCILSANGAISNVTLRQPGSSGGTLTYEGRFEILSLSGSFTITDNGGIRCRTGGISVSLAGPDGRVVGGGVAGLLLAASPIQVVVGSFLPNTYKEHKRRSNLDSSSFSPVPTTSALPTAARPISQANPGEECETPTSALPSQNHGDAENNMSNNSNPTTNLNSSSFRIAGWPGLQHSSPEHKPSPDINICPHGE